MPSKELFMYYRRQHPHDLNMRHLPHALSEIFFFQPLPPPSPLPYTHTLLTSVPSSTNTLSLKHTHNMSHDS